MKKIKNKYIRRVLLIMLIILSLGIIWAVFLSVNMLMVINTAPDYDENKNYTVIVLGCQVRKDGRPSDMLRERLIAALRLLNEHEEFVCVVTGGQGANEPLPEAHVMRDWLIDKGISPERIFIEDKSTSTRENLDFASAVIADNNLPTDVVIVSDGFHLYRAKRTASGIFGEVHTYAGYTYRRVLVPYWIREWAALTRDFISFK